MSGLVPGAYTIEAKADKLALRRPVRVTLSLGSSIEIALKLEIPRVHASATVPARGIMIEGNTVAPLSNPAEAAVTSFFPGLTVTYLPNRDRNFTQFTSQTASADTQFTSQTAGADGSRCEGSSRATPPMETVTDKRTLLQQNAGRDRGMSWIGLSLVNSKRHLK